MTSPVSDIECTLVAVSGLDPFDDPDIPPEVRDDLRNAVRIGITFSASTVLAENVGLQDVIQILSRFNRDQAIAQCAYWIRWNTWVLFHHDTWKPALKDCHELLDILVPPSAQLRASAIIEQENFVSPFSEISAVALVGLLCRYAMKEGGEAADTRSGQRDLFRALLALQDGIFPDNFLSLPIPDQFPFEVRVTLANVSLQNRWAYDIGRLHALLTVPEIGRKLSGMTVADWFQRRLGIRGEDYGCVVSTFFGSAFCGADYAQLPIQAPALYRLMAPIIQLSCTTPDNVVIGITPQMPQPDPAHLSDAVSYSNLLLIRPMLQLSEKLCCTSPRNLFNKLHRGLPYLCLEARSSSGVDHRTIRGEFGDIFEAYVVWLMRQWFTGPDVCVLTNFWISTPKGAAERDIAIISGDIAFIFEVKATVPTMKIRNFGNLQDLVSLHQVAAHQAFSSAKAFIEGTAFSDRELTQKLPCVTRAVPCSITYEFLAIRWPYSDFFEQALSEEVGLPLFSGTGGIAPFQILDIQQVELWDDLFRLPGEGAKLFQALINRASNPFKRYRDLPEDPRNQFRPDYKENPGIIRAMTDIAEVASQMRLQVITGG